MKSIAKNFVQLFFLLGIIFIPLQLYLLPGQSQWANWVFDGIITFLAAAFGMKLSVLTVSSDSTSLYLLMLILVFVAFAFSILLHCWSWWRKHQSQITAHLNTLFSFYLVFRLFSYGLDKVFKSQFYLPEPNLLYTPLGQLSKDILYWSTIGSSYSYNLVVGSFECLAGLLLLFRKTRNLGLVLALLAFGQIVLINFSFDISVKVLSTFLFTLTLYLVTPFFIRISRLLKNRIQENPDPGIQTGKTVRVALLTFLIGFVGIEVIYRQYNSQGFNDDYSRRPYLHGAYVLQSPAGLPFLLNTNPVKRFFVHRSGYMIFQHTDAQLQDLGLRVDSIGNKLWLTDYDGKTIPISFSYNPQDSVLTLQTISADSSKTIIGKAQNWKKLPLLKNDFHWTVDGI